MQNTPNYKLTKSQEKQLREKLAKTLSTMAIIIVSSLVLVVFFAPKLGVFFGFFSTHKNDKDPLQSIKPSPPLMVNVPASTKDNSITLNGFAPEGLTINLYANGPQVDSTLVGSDGQFTFNNVALIDGSNTIYAKAVDIDNNESDSSIVHTIIVDKEKPKIEITSPKDGDVIRNLNKRVTIIGKVNEKVQIRINERVAVQKPDLSFEFLLGIEEGETEIRVEVTDEAGNVAEEKFKVKYIKGN